MVTYVVVLKEVGNNSPAAMPTLDCSRDAGSFWEAPGHKGQGSLKPGHPVLCTKMPDEEHMLQAPPGGKFKFLACS